MATLEKTMPVIILTLVFFHIAFGNLFGLLRFSAIVLDHQLDLNTAKFSALLVDCQLKAVPDIFSKVCSLG